MAGKILLRLKIKSVPKSTSEIKFACIIHDDTMTGTAAIAPSSAAGTMNLWMNLSMKNF